jgi:hypothetical protein
VKQQKKDEKTQQFIDEVDALRTKYYPIKWKSQHDCTKPKIKTMVKWLSWPGDEKYIGKNGEMWARYQEIKDKIDDDRSHLDPGETIATAGSQLVAASASRKIAAGAGDADSSDGDSDAPTTLLVKRQTQNWKQKAVRAV